MPAKKTLKKVRTPKARVYRDGSGEIRWQLLSRNGAVIDGPQEGFISKRNALNNIERVRKAWAEAEIVVDL